jgi:hypothetical protein
MFNNFIAITAGKSGAELTDEERLMAEHFKSAIQKAQSSDKKSESPVGGKIVRKTKPNLLTEEEKCMIDAVPESPFEPEELIRLFKD